MFNKIRLLYKRLFEKQPKFKIMLIGQEPKLILEDRGIKEYRKNGYGVIDEWHRENQVDPVHGNQWTKEFHYSLIPKIGRIFEKIDRNLLIVVRPDSLWTVRSWRENLKVVGYLEEGVDLYCFSGST